MDLNNIKKIAIIRRNGFGDLLCTFPLIHYLKSIRPDIHITLYVENSNASLLPYLSGSDETIIFPKGNKYWHVLSTALKDRTKKYDLAISTKPSPMKLMNLFLYALGAKKRLAFVEKGLWHSQLINEKLIYNEEESIRQHQALKCLRMVNPSFREIPKEFYPKIRIPKKIRQRHERPLQDKLSSLCTKGSTLLISVSNNRESGCFGAEGYSDILNQLYRLVPFKTIISTQLSDIHVAQELNAKLECPSLIIPTPSFDQFLILLSLSDLVFSADGGIMHMAAALGIPQVTLFAYTRLCEWHPLTDNAICFYDKKHVNNIPREPVIDALLKYMENKN